MKIALLGYGKMGKAIERQALAKGHEIVLKIHSQNAADLIPDNLRHADVAIEFSKPETAFENVATCLRSGVPVVVGTTAWLSQLPEAKRICDEAGGAFLYASNFSIGVNLFFALNRYLAALMDNQPQYSASMEEIHHAQKLDYPSGTAITLAEGILENTARLTAWRGYLNEIQEAPSVDEIPILSKRIDPVPGTHTVTWASEIDTIEIRHTARSREGFAAGALAAAEWLVGKKGCFEMKDMIGF